MRSYEAAYWNQFCPLRIYVPRQPANFSQNLTSLPVIKRVLQGNTFVDEVGVLRFTFRRQ